jgi:hypothetical protein
VNRHALLVVSFAALFGLRAPLCVFACVQEVPSAPVASSAPDSAAPPPCHGSADDAVPEAPATGHECDCASFQIVLTQAASSKFGVSLAAVVPVPRLAWLPLPAAPLALSPAWTKPQDLPPPNVLLLKSTLLV